MSKNPAHIPAPRRRKRLVKWTFHFFSGLAVAVIYFIVFSLFFDTPIEYELKKSTARIEREYRALEQRYTMLQEILENVSERDRSVYKILFEADPATQAEEDRQRGIAFRTRLDGMTNKELGNYFDEHLGLLYQRVSNYDAMTERLHKRVAEDLGRALATPAIQPVDNRQLKLLTASFGERVHPFFKTMSQHNGVDYSVPTGSAVFATADGTVQSLQTRGQTSGLSLTIDHGNGYQTVYSHLDKVTVEPGRYHRLFGELGPLVRAPPALRGALPGDAGRPDQLLFHGARDGGTAAAAGDLAARDAVVRLSRACGIRMEAAK